MMTDPEFASFSHAALDPPGRRALRAKLIVGDAKVHTASFLRRHGEEVGRASRGLIDVLSAWLQSEGTIDDAMTLPLTLRTIRGAESDPVWIAALSAAHLHVLGRDGEWHALLKRPAPLAFGLRVTPAVQEISVSAHCGRVEVRLDGGAAVEIGALPFRMHTVDIGRARVPILGSETQTTFPVDDSAGFADVPACEVACTLAEASLILSRSAPLYLGWVEDALSAVVPLPRPSVDATQSFSVQGLNGIVFASFPAPALKIAELLVHECSHQFYHFGQLDTLFTNGMDAQLYWSPYVQKERPIDRIFIAFHAFANIVLFYRACLSAGMSEGHEHVEQTIKSNLGHLGPMSGYLERSPGLSPTGRGLFEPLREKLFR